ncbi:MAG: filamentous hemagglutinin N-terminal domain-containing protein [Alphaproteobacteria bacterium]
MKAMSLVRSRRRVAALLALLLGLIVAPAGYGQITLDGSLGPSGALTGPNFVIPADVGQLRGGNLFHSFGLFNVLTGQSATFTGPDTINNIVGRVTGGQQSTINGLLRSDIAGANLYLLNPAGIVFGQNASLDVKGSFHVSTADYVKFADGAKFYSDLGRQSVLTTAAISSFGFLTQNPAGLSIQGSTLRVPQGQTISLIGGNIDVTNSTIWAPGGRINMASVASPGEVTPVSPGADLAMEGFSRLGNVNASGSLLSVEGVTIKGDAAGAILIRGGQIIMQRSSVGARGNPGGLLSIEGEGLDLSRTFVTTGTQGAANHSGTAVDIDVSGLAILHNGSEIASSSSGAGKAGNIRIQAGSIVLGDDDPASSPFAGSGFYGDIGSRAFSSGRGGDVYIMTGSLTVKNGFFINTAAQNTGDAGNVTVRTDKLTVLDGASISSNGFGIGRGGIVDIEAGDALISARNINSVPNCACFTGIASQTGFGSPGGAVRITADTLQLLDGGRVSTVLFSSGPGANIDINAKQLVISGVVNQATASPSDVHASIDARLVGTFAGGNGGNISVTADSIEVKDGGFISSSLFSGAPGTAGDISIQARQIEISDRGLIAASSVFGTGKAGAITVTGESLRITGVANALDPFGIDSTGLTTATGTGSQPAGDVRLNLTSLELKDKGGIGSVSLGPGNAGNIGIQLSGDLNIEDGALINASTFGSGNGGTIDISARNITVSGVGQINGLTDPGFSAIASQSGFGGGKAGNIRISSGSLNVLDGAAITAETFGPGNGGNIEVHSDKVLISGVNAGLKDALLAGGADPRLAGARISSSSNGELAPGLATGSAGNILLATQSLALTDGGQIFAETGTPGAGGSIGLVADRINLSNGASISSKSSGSGNAGDISIQANQFRSVDSSVTTESETADGGNVHLQATSLVELVNSQITAEVKSGVGSGGNITIDPTFVILNDSHITANAFGGPGGNITIIADVFLASPESSVTASSALSTEGTVDIQAPTKVLSGTLAPLPENVLQASALIREACAPRLSRGQVSSLVAAGREGLAWTPGTLMPSPLYRLEKHSGSYFGQNSSETVVIAGLPSPLANSLKFNCSKQ